MRCEEIVQSEIYLRTRGFRYFMFLTWDDSANALRKLFYRIV